MNFSIPFVLAMSKRAIFTRIAVSLLITGGIAFAQTNMSYDVQGPLIEPRIFAEGIISSGDYDSHPAFSPDSKTLFFVKMAPDLTKWTIFLSNYARGKWSKPQIAPFSGQYWDADPYFIKMARSFTSFPIAL